MEDRRIDDFPDFMHAQNLLNGDTGNDGFIYYFDAIKFCSQLVYDNYDDWFVPSIKQIQDYIRNNPLEEELIIPNKGIYDLTGIEDFSSLTKLNSLYLRTDWRRRKITIENIGRMIAQAKPNIVCLYIAFTSLKIKK